MSLEHALAHATAALAEFPLLKGLLSATAMTFALFVVILALEHKSGGDLNRYRTRNFVTDVLYALFYRGGIYNVLIYAPIFALIESMLPPWRLNLLSHLPPPVAFFLFWLLADFASYWIHRWQHTSPVLWAFHSVHHAQTHMTFVTSFRIHVVEQLFANLILYVPLMILGMPAWYWAPIYVLQNLFEALQHSDLNWRYGTLYPVFVSPVFHAIHHSPERRRHDSNYGKVFSLWDRMFGTIAYGDRPSSYGVVGLEMGATFWATTVAPFEMLGRWARGTPYRAPVS